MIYDIQPVNNYEGNGSSTTFDFDFYIENESQLEVYFFDEDDNKTKLELDVDYSVNKVKSQNGSYITFPIEGSNYPVLQENQKISIELTLPISQETQYTNSDAYNPDAYEYSLDYLTRLIQIAARKLSRCVKVEECSKNTPDELIEVIKESEKTSKESAQTATQQAQNAEQKALEAAGQAELANQKALLASEFLNEIADFDFQPYDSNKTYSIGNWVVGVVDNKKCIFESVADSNLNNSLSNTSFWKKMEFNPVVNWGQIKGTLSNQTDLQNSLNSLQTLITNLTTTVNTKVNKATATSASLPSTKNTALTLGASGTSYTAPADGWVVFQKYAGITAAYISLINSATGLIDEVANANASARCAVFMPVLKNNKFTANYSATGNTVLFKFVYAQGAQ